ncbi:uncharacterized protein G2W53_033643 [Senna tora]|uniref:Uncharacterized protein n=1 Tax=Senna tora TaxID=362788 RepID=A0A834T0G6_9FABA|nr:uncharacterized protein G2W53_033643 [Senna tora]
MRGAWIMSQHIPDEKSRSDLRNLHELGGKRLVEQVSQTCRFENRSGFDAPIGVVLAWVERRSRLNIFRMRNRGRISETFTNYEAKDLLRNLDHVSTYSGGQIAAGSQKPSRIMRQMTCCARAWIMSQHIPDDKSRSDLINLHELRGKRLVAQVSQTRRFPNQSGFDAPIGVVLAWEERGSCLNIFQTTNRGRISETFTNYEAKDLLRNVSNTWVRVVFANWSGFDAPIGVNKAWEEHGSCLNIFRTTNRGRNSETSRIRRQKTCCASESNTSVRVVFANRSDFDAPIGVVLAWEERGSRLNIFRMKNRGRISETFTNYEAKTCCASESNTSVRVVLANRSDFDAPIGVVLAWEERGSCVKIFRTTNHGRISETFTNYEAKDLLRNEANTLVREPELFSCSKWSLLGMGGAWIMSQLIPDEKSQSDLRNLHELRGKRLVAQVSQTRQFANRSSFQAPIGVVLACEERGSCLNIFRTTNRVRILETFTNYEAKDLLRK